MTEMTEMKQASPSTSAGAAEGVPARAFMVRLALVTLFAASGAPAWAAAGAASTAAPDPGPLRLCETPEAYSLPNGVEERLLEDHSLPAIAVISSVHAGYRHDPRGREGLAHYVEHLTFRAGPANVLPDKLDDAIGAFDRNAFTRPDTTDFFSIVPPEQLELALWIEARRLAVGLESVAEKDAEEELEVLLREHAQRFAGSPELAAHAATNRALYPEGHPYRREPQSKASQEQLTLGAARWFFARHYRPDRVRLVILGDFRGEQAKALVTRLFGGLTAKDAAAAAAVGSGDVDPAEECRIAARPAPFVPQRVVVKSPNRGESLAFSWPVPFGENGLESLPPLAWLGKRIEIAAKELRLAEGVTWAVEPSELGQSLQLEVRVIRGKPFEKVDALVRAEMARFQQETPTAGQVTAERQMAEMVVIRERGQMLARGLRLARRECQAIACFEPGLQTTAATFARRDRFDPRKAIVVEQRFSGLAAPEGDVQSSVLGAAP